MRFSKKLRAGNPAIFCFPITGKFLHYLAKRCTFEKGKQGPPGAGGPQISCLQVLRAGAGAVVAPVLLEHIVVAAKRLVVPCMRRGTRSGAQPVGIAGGGCAEVEVTLVG